MKTLIVRVEDAAGAEVPYIGYECIAALLGTIQTAWRGMTFTERDFAAPLIRAAVADFSPLGQRRRIARKRTHRG